MELFIDSLVGVGGDVGANSCVTEGLEELEGVGEHCGVGEDKEDVFCEEGFCFGFELGCGGWDGFEEEREDDVSHGEACGWECRGVVAKEGDEVVVATATGDCPEVILAVEDFEDWAGVVGEAADDGEVGLDEVAEASCFEVLEYGVEFGWWWGLNEVVEVVG